MRTRLFQIGRSQIHGNSAGRKFHSAYFGRSLDSLTGFFDRGIRETHNIKSRKSICNVALYSNMASSYTVNTHSVYTANHLIIS